MVSHDRQTASRVCLFGEPYFEHAGRSLPLALPARAVALLALLALDSGRPSARTTLAATLWPDVAESAALANLRRYLHLIARAGAELSSLVVQTKSHVRWNERSPVACDLAMFASAAESKAPPGTAIELYRGELCAGIDDPVLDGLRIKVEAFYRSMLRACVTASLESGDRAAALPALRRLATVEPYDEQLARDLISTHLALGDRAAALREYHALVERLHDDLGAAPEESTSGLLPKLLYDAERLAPPHNIVRPGDSFLARDDEMATLARALRDERIISIVGSPGIGKTRLALEVAHASLDRFASGVWFVELARHTTRDAVLEHIAETIGIPRTADPLEGLTRALTQSDTLLVLDNLEQLGPVAREVVETLSRHTQASLLATSRRRTFADGEHSLTLAPLEIPPATPTSPETLARIGSVKLFLERATKVAPAMRVDYENARSLGSIARKLDGVPLALELVASRANLLTLDGIAKRLDDHLGFSDRRRTERHVTIEAAVAWSYDLLAENEKRVLQCVAVFGDSWTIDALEAVAFGTVDEDVVGIISELVESSLMATEHRPAGIRYRVFETTRALAGLRLDEGGGREPRSQRHADYYMRLAESLARDLSTEAEQVALERYDRERSNFDAALTWSTARDVPRAARLVAALAKYWVARGLTRHALRAVAELEGRPEIDTLGVRDTARFALAAATIAREIDFPKAETYLRRAGNAFAACGDLSGENEVRYARGAVSLTRGDFDASAESFGACLSYYRTVGDERGAAGTLANLAQVEWVRGNLDAALEQLESARAGFERTGNVRGIAHVFRSRAVIYGTLGRHEEAVAHGREAVLLYERLHEPTRVAEALTAVADACATAGRFDEAFDAVLRSLTILRDAPHDVFLLHAIQSLLFACAGIGEYENVLRLHAISERYTARIGRSRVGLEEFHVAVDCARDALTPAVAEAALASGVSLGIDFCFRVARRARSPLPLSDVHRTQQALP